MPHLIGTKYRDGKRIANNDNQKVSVYDLGIGDERLL